MTNNNNNNNHTRHASEQQEPSTCCNNGEATHYSNNTLTTRPTIIMDDSSSPYAESTTTTTPSSSMEALSSHSSTSSSHYNHYSINFFNLPLKNSCIPTVWHKPLQWQASIILFTVYSGYVLQTIYTFKKQGEQEYESTFWVFIIGVLTILVNSGRLIRMEKAENTLESKVIILFNILSFSIRFYVLKTNRGILLSNALATVGE